MKSRKEVENLLRYVQDKGTERYLAKVDAKSTIAETYLEIAENIGVAVRGEYDENGAYHVEHYFPYLKGKNVSTKESVTINKRVDTDAYTGMCEDFRVGVSMMFYLQNVTEYLSVGSPEVCPDGEVTLSALASDGKIILPTVSMKNAPVDEVVDPSGRMQLMEAARKGDREAMEALTIDDIDLYAKINKRLKTEDIYSIVETTFVPYGSESDNYAIVGIIERVQEVRNAVTDEILIVMDLRCNNILFPVCINKKDLLGEPKAGRRFRGNVWMQGIVNFR